MKRDEWLELTELALQTDQTYSKTVYVHVAILPGGSIVIAGGTHDRALGRRKLYPKVAGYGYKYSDFREVIHGEYGGLIRVFFLPTEKLLEESDQIPTSDPLGFGDGNEPEIYGVRDIPGYDFDDEVELNEGGLDFDPVPEGE